jgi:alpha-beta hydrolase superfamily lysophospholipase
MVLRHQAKVGGLILSSPALKLRVTKGQKRLLNIMLALAPGLPVSNGLNVHALSHDVHVVAAYRADPLVHGKITARCLRWMLDTQEALASEALLMDSATLLMPALEDRLVDPEGSLHLARQYAGPALHYKPQADAFHEIFNEESARRGKALNDLDQWLKQRT